MFSGVVYEDNRWSSQHKEVIVMFFQKLTGVDLDNPSDFFKDGKGKFHCDASARLIIIDMTLYNMFHVSWCEQE